MIYIFCYPLTVDVDYCQDIKDRIIKEVECIVNELEKRGKYEYRYFTAFLCIEDWRIFVAVFCQHPIFNGVL